MRSIAMPRRPSAEPFRHRSGRAAASLLAVVLAGLGGAGAGAALVTVTAYSSHSWCPFDTTSGLSAPRPGGALHNASANATTYANGSVVFLLGASGCTPPYSVELVFGDGGSLRISPLAGTSASPQSFVHVYASAGYFSGSITFQDAAGHSAATFFCVAAPLWPAIGLGSGSSPPACP